MPMKANRHHQDRGIMENVPYLVIEGMITAGLVTGARQGILYIRHEYDAPERLLQKEIDRCYSQGLLDLESWAAILAFRSGRFLSARAATFAERKAHCSRPLKVNAPNRVTSLPSPVTNGLWNQPTVINNVETFCLGGR